MKECIREFFWNQRRDPLPSRLLDLEKTALVIKGFTLGERVYHGTEDLEEIEYREHDSKSAGKLRGKVTRAQLCRPAETVTAAGSVIRKLPEKRLVQLLHDETYESAAWDVFGLLAGRRGYKPWDKPDASELYSIEPEDEYSDLWTPVRRRMQSGWSGIFYWPWRLCTHLPLKGERGHELSRMFIDLSADLQSQHERLVTAAY
jgi:hypothetical protein